MGVKVFSYLCGMERLLTLIVLTAITKDINKSVNLVQQVYGDVPKHLDLSIKARQPKDKPMSKREELENTLSELKSKRVKTKVDKQNIYTLEQVIKNMP